MNRNHERGQAIVEFALVAPVILLLFIGATEIGMAMLNTMRLQNAATTIAAVPSVEIAEIDRLSFTDCTVTVDETSGTIRVVLLDCANPWPLTSILVPRLTAEATHAI